MAEARSPRVTPVTALGFTPRTSYSVRGTSRPLGWTASAILAVAEGALGWAPGALVWRVAHGIVVARLALAGGRPTAATVVAAAAGLIALLAHASPPPATALTELALQTVLLATIAGLGRSARRAAEWAREAAGRDAMTGLLNGVGFRERLASESSRLQRTGETFSLIVLDGDRFKQLNDMRGHVEGDRCLIRVAELLRTHTRPYDSVGRLGGDEFAVLLPETDALAAGRVTERLLASLLAEVARRNWDVGFSAGVVTFTTCPESPDAAIAAADALMYEAKRSGKAAAFRQAER